jgi:hypothetical protein
MKRVIVKYFIVFLFLYGTSYAQWFEYENPGIGNLTSARGDTSQYPIIFHEIPDSPFVIYSNGHISKFSNEIGFNAIILDCVKSEFRCINKNHNTIKNPVILPDPASGWVIIYADSQLFKSIHININAEFGPIVSLDKTYNFPLTKSIGIPERGEAWFVSDKIFRYKVSDKKWTDFQYPPGWDTDLNNNSPIDLFLSDDDQNLFVRATGNTIQGNQLMMIDLFKGKSQLVKLLQENEIGSIIDIKEWKGHEGSFIFLWKNSLSIYNSLNNSIELITDQLNTNSRNISQTSDGRYVYLFGVEGDDLYIIDVDNKILKQEHLPIEDGWIFKPFSSQFFADMPLTYFDESKMQIISLMQTIIEPAMYKPAIVDLNDLSVKFIPGIKLRNDNIFYLEDRNMMIGADDTNSANVVNLATGGMTQIISLAYQSLNWSILENEDTITILINNYLDTEICRFSPLSKRERYDVGMETDRICQFPDGNSCLVKGIGEQYREYSFKDHTYEDLQLPYPAQTFIPVPDSDIIVGFNMSKSNSVQFIKHHGNIKTWIPSDDNFNFYWDWNQFDPDNNAIWFIAKNNTFGNWIFIDISLKTFKEEKSIFLPPDSFDYISRNYFKVDPLQRYMYVINETLDAQPSNRRELKIIDINKGEIIKTIILQDNLKNGLMDNTAVKPCIVPIPEQDKLFLWDGYGSWCIDTETMEILYGKAHSNPTLTYAGGVIETQGVWDEERQRAIVVDNSYEKNVRDPMVFDIDIQDGSIKNQIGILPYPWLTWVYFPKDRTKLVFLGYFSDIETLYLMPEWKSPALINLSTNYIEYSSGDKSKFTVNVKNPLDVEQKATAFIWLYAPGVDTPFFFDGVSLTTNVRGIPLTLPSNLDVTGDILTFTMPAGLPEGFYNFNAVFINENGDRGPIGTWNFYVKD